MKAKRKSAASLIDAHGDADWCADLIQVLIDIEYQYVSCETENQKNCLRDAVLHRLQDINQGLVRDLAILKTQEKDTAPTAA